MVRSRTAICERAGEGEGRDGAYSASSNRQSATFLGVVLVLREMEWGRSPLVSIPGVSVAEARPITTVTGTRKQGRSLQVAGAMCPEERPGGLSGVGGGHLRKVKRNRGRRGQHNRTQTGMM